MKFQSKRLSRRSFLGASALLGATALAGPPLTTVPVLLASAQSGANGHASRAPQPRFAEMRQGLFVHYTFVGRPYPPGCTTWSDGSPVATLDELADQLDIDDLVQTAASMRAQYLQITAWHANMNVLYPSPVMARYLPGHCSRRDVLRALIAALRPTGIRLVLYLHPSDGDDFSREDQDRVGWNDAPPFARWNDFINQVFAEVAERYGQDVAGYWIDGGLPQQVDPARLRTTLLSRDPDAWLIQNSGLNRACVDFGAHETLAEPYPATAWQMNGCISGTWWAHQNFLHLSPELALKYVVLQAGVPNNAGGVAWSVGPHPGGRWETGVREFAQTLGRYIDPIAPALFGTHPSPTYPIAEGTPLRTAKFVATESKDNLTTYLHILWAPQTPHVALPPPADNRRFASAKLLLNGHRVALHQDAQGLRLSLAEKDSWDLRDTVIALR